MQRFVVQTFGSPSPHPTPRRHPLVDHLSTCYCWDISCPRLNEAIVLLCSSHTWGMTNFGELGTPVSVDSSLNAPRTHFLLDIAILPKYCHQTWNKFLLPLIFRSLIFFFNLSGRISSPLWLSWEACLPNTMVPLVSKKKALSFWKIVPFLPSGHVVSWGQFHVLASELDRSQTWPEAWWQIQKLAWHVTSLGLCWNRVAKL